MTNKDKATRIAAIDTLRCIAIIGMVLSANIGFSSGLPAWMFHAQTPPPTYAFDPSRAGLTWVDLVFPFFLLSMGAALPFSIRKKLSRGEGMAHICLALAKRWVTLTLFALALGNAYRAGSGTQADWATQLLRLGIWVSMCLSLMRIPGMHRRLQGVLNLSGLALCAACAWLMQSVFGIRLDTGNDVIIMILAVSSLFGGVIWLLTRDNLRLRLLALALVAALKASCSYIPQFHFPDVPAAVGWCFQWSYLQYLIPVLLGSVMGDMLIKDRESAGRYLDETSRSHRSTILWAGVTCLSAILIQLWGLHTRHVAMDISCTATLTAVFALGTRKTSGQTWARTGLTGLLLTLAGTVFDPIDGGIAKDPCNLSYLLTTSGMGMSLVSVLLSLEQNAGASSRFLSAVGQNPMIAYTITGFVICPVLSLAGIMPLLWGLSEGSAFWGVMQGVLITLAMMLCTAICTRIKLFWRS